MKKIIFTLMYLIVCTFGKEAHAEEMITVKLVNYIQDTSNINVKLKGNYLTLSPTLTFEEGVNYSFIVKNDELYVKSDREVLKIPGSLTLVPHEYNENHLIYINDRPYLGAMEFKIEDEKFIRPINQLPLEDYLKGVVPFEVFPSWDIEALKAQSLAARTYAFMQSNADTMMNDTIQFQVYGGYSTYEKTNRAVEETKGEIITYNGKPISAFYSASNGGYTESNSNVWGGSSAKYLPIKKDPYDPGQPWEFTLHQSQINVDQLLLGAENYWSDLQPKDKEIASSINNWLRRKGYHNPQVISIPHFEISSKTTKAHRSISGSITISFVHRLLGDMIFFDQISLKNVPLSHIRPIIGGSIFKSYLIESLTLKDGIYTMKGKGYGHGVGMSQWGANGMASEGKNYEQIIEFYFPNTEIKKMPGFS